VDFTACDKQLTIFGSLEKRSDLHKNFIIDVFEQGSAGLIL